MLNKMLEPLTAMGCALGAASMGALDGGLTAGAIIGGSALIARYREGCAKHGLDSAALIDKMRLAVLKDWDRADQPQAERDAIALAVNAMGDHIADCLPTRQGLAATALKGSAVYPAAAAALVVDRLAARDAACAALFAAPPPGEAPSLSRRFALEVVERAMCVAKDDPAYAPLLTLDLVIEVAAGVGRLERAAHDDRTRDEAFQTEMLAFIRAQAAGSKLSDDTLIAAMARFIAIRPDASREEILDEIARFEHGYRALLDQVRQITVIDNHVASLKAAAEEALTEPDVDLDRARALYAEAVQVARDKLVEPVRNIAQMQGAAAGTALLALDWADADRNWAAAEAMLAPFDRAGADDTAWQATEKLLDHGTLFGARGALDAAIARARTMQARLRGGSDTDAFWAWSNLLGNVLQRQGERTGGEAGLTLLADAVAAYRAALTVRTHAAMPADWAMTQNNLGNALATQGERTGGEAGLVLLAEAVAAYRAALTVYTESAMPANWAATLNNLGAALQTQGERTGGEAGLALLAEAVAAYRAALTVRTESAMPAQWAMTQNNLGTALRAQGERTGGEAGLVLLAEAVAAYRAALTVYTESAMPANWAATLNNLGNALRTQGERTGGAAGLALLADAVAANRDALSVYTHAAMPAQWAMTQENIALAFEAMAARGDDPLPELREAEVAVLAALTIYTPEHMPFYHEKATRLLARIRAKITERGG